MCVDQLRAKDVAERLLKQTGDAMQEGDFALFAACFDVPTEIETFEGRRMLSSRAELEDVSGHNPCVPAFERNYADQETLSGVLCFAPVWQ